MDVSTDTRGQLDQENLVTVKDFEDFNSYQLEKLIKTLWFSIAFITDQVDPNLVWLVLEVTPTPPCVVSENFNLRLSVESQTYSVYQLQIHTNKHELHQGC